MTCCLMLLYFPYNVSEEPAVLDVQSRRNNRFPRSIFSIIICVTKHILTRKTVGCYINSSCCSRHLNAGVQVFSDCWFPAAQVRTLELDHPVEQTSWTNCTVESTEGDGGLSVWLLLQTPLAALASSLWHFSLTRKIFPNTINMISVFPRSVILKVVPHN